MKPQPFDFTDFDLSEGWHLVFDGDIRNIIKAGFKNAKAKKGHNRADVAGLMSKRLRLQKPITETTANKWTCEDGNGNRFPLEYSQAFAEVTGDPRILLFYPALCGLNILTPGEWKRYLAFRYRQKSEHLKKKAELLEGEADGHV